MTDRLYFTYERLPPFLYREPRDIRNQLMGKFCYEYKDKPLSNILLSTEFVLKVIKSKDPSKTDKPILRYRIVSVDWEDIRTDKKTLFTRSMFKFLNTTDQNYE